MAAIAPWFRLRLPSCGPGFESQAHHLGFFQFVLLKIYRENNKNKQKETGIGPFFKCLVLVVPNLFVCFSYTRTSFVQLCPTSFNWLSVFLHLSHLTQTQGRVYACQKSLRRLFDFCGQSYKSQKIIVYADTIRQNVGKFLPSTTLKSQFTIMEHLGRKLTTVLIILNLQIMQYL